MKSYEGLEINSPLGPVREREEDMFASGCLQSPAMSIEPQGLPDWSRGAMRARLKLLKSTDGLASWHGGLQKQWPLENPDCASLVWDFIQKINYSVQDFNDVINEDGPLRRQDIVFLIALADWINEAIREILGCYRKDVLAGFSYACQGSLDKRCRYFRAVRAFVAAHPLKTDQHAQFGLNGDLVCVDIRGKEWLTDLHKGDLHRLVPDGMDEVSSIPETDIVLYAYSKGDGARFFHYIGFDLKDVRDFAALDIDKLYAFDRYLGLLKERDFCE